MPNKLTILRVSLWYYSLLLLGVFMTILGPTLPDLQDYFRTSLDDISSLFLILGLSLSFGCLVSVVLMKYLEPSKVLAVCLLLEGVCISTVAITPYLWVACLAIAGSGIFIGCVFNMIVHQSNITFPKSSILLHFLLTAVAFGAYVTPLLVEPFLGHSYSIPEKINPFPLNGSEPSITDEPSINATGYHSSALSTNEMTVTGRHSSSSGGTEDTTDTHRPSYFRADVRMLYVLLGLLNVPAVIGQIIFVKLNKNETVNESLDGGFKVMDKNKNSLKFLVFLSTLLLTYVSFCGLPFAYGSLLTTYGVDSSLRLSVQRMAVMTSVYWLHHFIGRILGTVSSTCISQTQLIFICLGAELISGIMLCIPSLGEIGLWVESVLIALFSGPLVAAMFSWARSHIHLSPLVLGMCSFADTFGLAILPFCAGQLMAHFGVNVLMYFFVSQSLFQLVLFIILSRIGFLMGDIG